MKKLIFLISLLMGTVSSFAASRVVTGVIKDEKGVPVIGAYVTLSGNATVGSVVDIDGKYSLSIPDTGDAKLQYACYGYETVTVDVGGRSVIDVVLKEEARLLDEAVVVGYGSMKRSDLTGSVASVEIDEAKAARSSSIDQLIQGRAAGVKVTSNSSAPDAGVVINIRGMNTFNGESEPLYVVDGIIINSSSSSETLSKGSMMGEETNGLMGINPQDIASIEILKDASATAIYGSQGANGVVLITTKSAQSDKPVINLSAGIDIGTPNKHIDMLDMDMYADFAEEIGMSRVIQAMYENPSTRQGLKVDPVDWQEYTLRTAISQRYYFSIGARPKNTSYLFSVGYNNKQGIVRNTDVRQFTMRLNLDHTFKKNFKIGTRTSFAYINSNLTQGANSSSISSGSSMLRSMLAYKPYVKKGNDLEDDDWELADEDDNSAVGPNRWFKYFRSTRKQYNVTPSIYAQIKIAPWLSFKSTLGANLQLSESDKFKSRNISRSYGSTGSSTMAYKFRYNFDNMFMFDKQILHHSLSGTVGITSSSSITSSQGISGWYINQDMALTKSLNGSVSPFNGESYSETKFSLLSGLARLVYDYDSRYVLTATFRADGSSRFQGSNKWGFFPSVAAAWRIAQEPWFHVNAISAAKLRLGWGRVGNQGIPSYRTLPLYAVDTIADHNETNESGTQVGIHQSYISNPDLKWETSEQANAGLDLGFFKGRLTLSADVYYKYTRDLLQSKNIARTSGYSSMWVNQGNISNRGLELTIDAVPVKVKDFEWQIGGNISFNRNRIENIGADIQTAEIYLAPGHKEVCNFFWGSTLKSSTTTTSILNIFIEGQPMGLFYGMKALGVVQLGEAWPAIGTNPKAIAQAGDIKYMDINGDGCITEDDRTIIGDPNPDFTYGFNTSFSWKNLTVSADFNGVFGNDIYNYNLKADLNTNPTTSILRNVRTEAYTEAWRLGKPSDKYPRLQYTDDYLSDRFVEDASFLRLANLTASYALKFSKKKSKVLRGITFGATVGNVFVVTKYSQWDPEVNSYGSDIGRYGIDAGSYPAQRTYSFDLKFTF